MKYVTILSALIVACLLAVPALAAHNGNCNGDGIRDCTNDCIYGNQDGSGNQNGNGHNGNQSGNQDGSGPDRNRDESCQV
jgi:hypothetical protein